MCKAIIRKGLIAVSLCCALTLAGCGKSSPQAGLGYTDVSGKKYARGTKPYAIDGKTYYPLTRSEGFKEEGVASWYGPGFHGKTTANGETYNMHSMTAAHKVLPFDTNVRVTNLQNGRSIVVRINDRGPFVDDRVIDLTKNGAHQLGLLSEGTGKVRLESLGSPAPEGVPARPEHAGRYYVQVGSFSQKQNAQTMAKKLSGNGMGSRMYLAVEQNVWRVQAGPFSSWENAQQASNDLRSQFYNVVVLAE